MGAVLDLAPRLRARHPPMLAHHPLGTIRTPGVPGWGMVKVCVTCETRWPCATIRHLNNNAPEEAPT